MFLFWVLIFPILIGAMLIYVLRPAIGIRWYFNLFLKYTHWMFTYTLLMYYLEQENIISTGWVAYSLLFYWLVVVCITLTLGLIVLIRNNNDKTIDAGNSTGDKSNKDEKPNSSNIDRGNSTKPDAPPQKISL